jgi:sulfite reductase subunit B
MTWKYLSGIHYPRCETQFEEELFMQKHSVLIVDDEPIVRESIRDWLKDAGYNVSTAQDGEEALKLAEKQDFSVLITDIRLPGQSGLSVLKLIKDKRPWIKSIIITAYPSEETTAEANRLGAIDYLIKPVVPDEMEKLVREALETIPDEATVTSAPKKPLKQPKTVKLKKTVVISKDGFRNFVKNLSKKMEIIGVKEKQGKYIYGPINDYKEICLSYDLTVNPPTKFFLPAREPLLKYDLLDSVKSRPIIEAPPRVLLGVHPYDIKAIELLDEVYMTTNTDPNYSNRRKNTIIIGVDCLNPSPKSFASSMGTHTTDSGFDLFLTDVGKKFVVTIGSKKGSDLLNKYADVDEPAAEDIAKQKELRDKALTKFKSHLDIPRERIAKLLEESYDDPFWERQSKTCLSCGSCVMVCPTCFCFDIKEEVSLNLKEGQRYRQWDGCVLADFAKVATGENFRHDKASRLRHRIYRKGKYLMEKYGMPGCVGCGRCVTACLAEIASPLDAFNAIAESVAARAEAQRIMRETKSVDELYKPKPAELMRVEVLGPREKVFTFKFVDGKILGQRPGQFVNVSVPGIGESPISVTSSPTRNGHFELAIRNVGSVTNAIHRLQPGATVGIRGPFGNGFPIKLLEGKDILFVAGGIGLFPLRSLIQYVMDERDQFGKVKLLLGSRSPEERMFIDELDQWEKSPDIEFMETVDKGDETWKGNVGVITTLIPKADIDPRKTMAIVVGPPIMYRFAIIELKKLELADENIIVSLERRMKCGVGKCGQCQINGVYVCQEGPVFTLAQLRNLREAI